MRNGMRSLWDFDAEDGGSDEVAPTEMSYGPSRATPLSIESIGPQIQARLEAGDPPGKIAMYLEQLEPGLGRALLGQINQAARSMDRVSAPSLSQENYGGLPAHGSSPSFAVARIPMHQSFLASAGGGVAQAMNGVAAPESLAEPSASRPPSRAVRAIADGRVGVVGWQNPKHRSGEFGGMGWRIYVDQPDGSRIGYGHMDPGSTLKPGTPVKRGDIIGRYADPANGHANAPHVHVQKVDKRGNIVDPGNDNPLANPGGMTSPYLAKERPLRKKPHQGVDWAECRR